ncbi:NPC intracellular cholesterol transporter 2-like [Oppia nitens]|uniref:NPC intracellular cholesterol transporter 2-like n=1 Tax=Oppia nitens TaxID=1686743 RepID=UPI0023DA2C8C|nr:NPC intracellular cholesterol transporter 2-like [Oppia nitens]
MKQQKHLKQEIIVTPCASLPCPLKRGTNATLSVKFEIPEDSEKLMAKMGIIVGGLRLSVPKFDANLCGGYGVTCPVTKGTHYRYNYTIAIGDDYPIFTTTLRLMAKDDQQNMVFCFKVPISFVD